MLAVQPGLLSRHKIRTAMGLDTDENMSGILVSHRVKR